MPDGRGIAVIVLHSCERIAMQGRPHTGKPKKAILGRPSVAHLPPAFMSSSNFKPILDAALDAYAKQTGIDLTKHPSASKLQNCCSPDDLLQILSERESTFKENRDQYHHLIDRVRPVVQAVHALSVVLGEIAGLVSSGIMIVSNSRIFTPPNRCHSNQRKRFLSASTFFCRCVSPLLSPEPEVDI